MRNWMDAKTLSLDEFDPEEEGLYEALRRVGVLADVAHQSVGAAGLTRRKLSCSTSKWAHLSSR